MLSIITNGELSTLAGLQFNIGDLVMLAAIIFGALYNVLIRKVPRKIPDLSF